jgi:branched-chain amino acid transport system permease protein
VNSSNLAAIVISGLVTGSLYALMAGGLSLVWGTLRMFNFAHGALLMLGAYITWEVAAQQGLGAGLAAGALAGVLGLMLVGFVMQQLLVRPFVERRGGDLIVMITTLAAGTIIINGVQLIWGPRLKQLPVVAKGAWRVVGTAVAVQDVVIMLVAPALLILLAVFLKRAKLGLAIRAVEQNRDSALLTGVNVQSVYSLTFAVACGLAAVAGILLGAVFFVTPSMGDDPLLKAFIVIVFGGLGSLRGTIVGAYVIGLVESATIFFLGLYWTPVVLFGFMILVMVVRPTGLFAEE